MELEKKSQDKPNEGEEKKNAPDPVALAQQEIQKLFPLFIENIIKGCGREICDNIYCAAYPCNPTAAAHRQPALLEPAELSLTTAPPPQ